MTSVEQSKTENSPDFQKDGSARTASKSKTELDKKSLGSEKMMAYPSESTLCFFDRLTDVEKFLQSYSDSGLDMNGIDLLVGEKGQEIIDLEGTHHALYDRLLRMSQKFWGSGEWNFYEQAHFELQEGHYLIKVSTKEEPIKEQVIELMKLNNARDVKYFSSMYVEEVTHGFR